MKKQHNITILGGGIAGLTTAIALQKVGIKATVLEASEEIRPVGAGLGLGTNAIMAFEKLGLKKEITAKGHMLPAYSILDQQGRPIQKPFRSGRREQPHADNFAIHRADLHAFLVAQLAPASIIMGKRLVDLHIQPSQVQLLFEDSTRHTTDYLIVADGIHSPARQKLVPGSVPRYAGYTCWRAVVDQPVRHVLIASETWGRHGRFGMVPLSGGRVYWYACITGKQNDPALRNFKIPDLYRAFEGYHDPIPEIIQATQDENLLWNDILDLKPLKQFAYGRCLLIGDAAHATTPNMGQGACQAIEDAVVLAQCLNDIPEIEKAFLHFEQRRLARTRWVTETSRKVGQMAQLENPLLIALRNAAIRLLPDSVSEKQMQTIERVDF
jgi:2-polyprenyl-6-methoxyphenol hydroxylase-like FAD-dependent oxidoreductase